MYSQKSIYKVAGCRMFELAAILYSIYANNKKPPKRFPVI
jgi:hypothetical protein